MQVTTLSKQSEGVGDSCPFCHTPLRVDEEVVYCNGTCSRLYHADCWKENANKCATLGCNGNGSIVGDSQVLEVGSVNQVVNTLSQEPEILSQTSYVANPDPSLSSTGSSSLRIRINPRVGVYISLLTSLAIVYFVDWPISIGLAAIAVTVVVILSESYSNGSFDGIMPHITFASAAIFGLLAIALVDQVWPFLADVVPSLDRYSVTITIFLAGLFVHIGGWGSSRILSSDNSGLVRGIAGLSLVYATSLWALNNYDQWIAPVIISVAAVLLIVFGFWSDHFVLDPKRIAKSLLGALTMAGLVILSYIALFDFGFVRYLPFGRSALALPFTIRTLLTLAAIFGSSKSGVEFALGLYRFLLNVLVAGLFLGIVLLGGYFGFSLAGETFVDETMVFVGAAVGGLLGLVIALLVYRFLRSLIS